MLRCSSNEYTLHLTACASNTRISEKCRRQEHIPVNVFRGASLRLVKTKPSCYHYESLSLTATRLTPTRYHMVSNKFTYSIPQSGTPLGGIIPVPTVPSVNM